MMDHDLKLVSNRTKVTFTAATAKRLSTWELDTSMDEETMLDVLEDILVERRFPSGLASADEVQGKYPEYSNSWNYDEPVDSTEPVFDGIAFQPSKNAVVGGTIDLGNSVPKGLSTDTPKEI